MALTRTKKEDILSSYGEGFAAAPHAFLVDFKGINVPQATDLRSRIRGAGGGYAVVKNTLALRAIEGRPLAEVSDLFAGTTAVAYTAADPAALAKVLTEFRKEVPVLEFKGGVVEGRAVAAAEVETIAKLPSREELIAKLLYMLQSPVSRLVRGLGAIPRQLVVVLDQVRQQREG